MMLDIGTEIGDDECSTSNQPERRWKVVSFLGRGTCCETYKVESLTPPCHMAALKVYKSGPQFVSAHDSEAMLLNLVIRANGPCPNLVSTVADIDYGDQPCLVQELLDLDLRQILTKSQGHGLSLYLIQRLTLDILRGVQHLHKSGFVHADIKPTNLMWSPSDYCLKVIDYSLSYHVQDKDIGLIQSQGYRAPEAERWNEKISQKSGKTSEKTSGEVCQMATKQGASYGKNSISGNKAKTEQNNHNTCRVSPGVHIDSELEFKSSSRNSTNLSKGLSVDVQLVDDTVELSRTLLSDVKLLTSMADVSVPLRSIDMWSIGCVVMEMYHGSKVFTGATLSQLQNRQNQGESVSDCVLHTVGNIFHRDNSQRNYHVDALKDFVLRCFCISHTERWSAEIALKHNFFQIMLSPSFEDLCMLSSTILRLLNVVEEGDLSDDQQYEALVDDLRSECEKHGAIASCVIPRTGTGSGKVYIEYADWEVSQEAYSKLCHRIYNDHTVIVTYFPVDDFRKQNYY